MNRIDTPYQVDARRHVLALNKPGIGVELDESGFDAYPATDGSAYI